MQMDETRDGGIEPVLVFPDPPPPLLAQTLDLSTYPWKAVENAADGPVPESVRQTSLEPWIWYPSHVATFGFAAVVFLMAAKPSGVWSVIIVIVGVLIGLAVSRAQLSALTKGSPAAGAGSIPSAREAMGSSESVERS